VNDYPQQLADAVQAVVTGWLVRCVLGTAQAAGIGPSPALVDATRVMSIEASPIVMQELRDLLATDVDAQRTNPLSVLRNAVRYPTAVLHAAGVPVARRDEFAIRTFPTDVYNLAPATWSDIDEALSEPGLIWGAWKAKTVLDRRRGRATAESAEANPPPS
jgi:hypothetical protein